MISREVISKTHQLLDALSSDFQVAQNDVREVFRAYPEPFYHIAGTGLASRAESLLHSLMAADSHCCRHLCNPALLDARAAQKFALSLFRLDGRLDIRLAQAAIEWVELPDALNLLRRSLEIIEAMACGPRINSMLVQLLKCSNGNVRSKVFELLARSTSNEASIRQWLRDPDPRIRANLLEAIAEANKDMPWVRAVLTEHLNDSHGRVAANAAVGLYRLGIEAPAMARLSDMASSEAATIRCSAAWALGQIQNAGQFDLLNQLRRDSIASVRGNALKSLSRLNRAGLRENRDSTFPTKVEDLVGSTEAV
jgi:hypothetical protein